MSKKRREFTAEFKAKICIEVLKEEETVSEIASKYNIHPNQLHNWKNEFLANIHNVFKSKKDKKKEEGPTKDDLLKKIGEIEMENDWIKKKLKSVGML